MNTCLLTGSRHWPDRGRLHQSQHQLEMDILRGPYLVWCRDHRNRGLRARDLCSGGAEEQSKKEAGRKWR